MVKKGCKEKNMIAAIGPCIGKTSYNVRENFRKKFLKQNRKNNIFFQK